MDFTFPAIAIARSCFTDSFGIPRQPGLAPSARAQLEMLPPYDDPAAFEGIATSSHLWLQWVFHANKRQNFKPRVKPPRLGGNKTLGVFATRSPTRPAPIGLSVVRFERLINQDGKLLVEVSGVDLLDGTPILDIKPYIPYVDKVDAAQNSFAAAPPACLPVRISAQAADKIATASATIPDIASLITEILQQDPRPSYQAIDPARRYGMRLYHYDLQWRYEIDAKLGDNSPVIWVEDLITHPAPGT